VAVTPLSLIKAYQCHALVIFWKTYEETEGTRTDELAVAPMSLIRTSLVDIMDHNKNNLRRDRCTSGTGLISGVGLVSVFG
jgi:hypothetical protein